MKNISKALAYSSIIFFFSCNGKVNQDDAKSFYFPYQGLMKSKTYVFVNESDNTDTTRWYMHTMIEGKDTILLTRISNSKVASSEGLKERVSDKGTVMTSYNFYYTDSAGKDHDTNTEIKMDSIFKWKFNSNDSCRWKVNYSEGGSKIEFSKTRIFTGDSVSFSILGKNMMCMEFHDRFDMKVFPPEGEMQNYSYFIQSYYAKGIGLVSYKVNLIPKRRDYKLVKIEVLD